LGRNRTNPRHLRYSVRVAWVSGAIEELLMFGIEHMRYLVMQKIVQWKGIEYYELIRLGWQVLDFVGPTRVRMQAPGAQPRKPEEEP